MLTPWHYISIAAPLALLILKRGSKTTMVILFLAIVMAAAEAMIDIKIRAIRNNSTVPISSLPLTDPLRRRFGMLHGASSLLLLLQIGAAAVVVGRNDT
jgi:hypothetical protein